MTISESVSAGQLRAFIERIERLEEEKKTIADDIKEVKAEAKGSGFDVATINTIIRLRKKDASERAEAEAILDMYMVALGMLPPGVFNQESKGETNGPEVEPAASSFDEIAETNSNSQPTSSPDANKTGAEPPPSAPVAPIEDDFAPPAFLRKDERNERCMQPASCKFARHPQKITCSDCATAWQISQRKARQSEVA